ncbi:hypothetical protein GCM10011297_35320 [Bacterioplanes sanyensis]|nr:hypothetical protein GCM10011297_35320 [Bacterioplanes sanyensis]
MVKPQARRMLTQQSVAERKISIRLACQIFAVSETCYRYQPILSDENAEIAHRLIKLRHL